MILLCYASCFGGNDGGVPPRPTFSVEIGSRKLFAWTDLKLQSSQSDRIVSRSPQHLAACAFTVRTLSLSVVRMCMWLRTVIGNTSSVGKIEA
jgi:hypothetical protein